MQGLLLVFVFGVISVCYRCYGFFYNNHHHTDIKNKKHEPPSNTVYF